MNNSMPSDDVPDSLIEILCTRARYEEGIIAEIKVALAAGDKDLVFKLADQMFHEGPGTIPRTRLNQGSEGHSGNEATK